MNRRGLIKAILGGGAAAAVGVKPSDIMGAVPKGAMMGGGMAAGRSVGGIESAIGQMDPIEAAMRKKTWALQRVLIEKRERLAFIPPQMPPHIQGKKSWSPVYRHSEWTKELREVQAAMEALEDPQIGAKIWDMLMGGDE